MNLEGINNQDLVDKIQTMFDKNYWLKQIESSIEKSGGLTPFIQTQMNDHRINNIHYQFEVELEILSGDLEDEGLEDEEIETIITNIDKVCQQALETINSSF